MTIYFANEETIDLDTIRTMGVNVKTSDSPLGFFGTGLKFAIATLLRTGHVVQLMREDDLIEFTLVEKTIRNHPFNIVHMDGEPLGFTDQLGRNWEVWQAYRELHSNCVDEAGIITDNPEGAIGGTVWMITGDDITAAFMERDRLFLSSEPLFKFDGVEVHEGETNHLYYRGVRAYDLPVKSKYTYNFTRALDLTEDRTIKSITSAEYFLGCVGLSSENVEFVTHLIGENSEWWDSNVNHTYCWNPSKEALLALREKLKRKSSNRYAGYVSGRSSVLDLTSAVTLTDEEKLVIAEALKSLDGIQIGFSEEELVFVASLNGRMYEVEDGIAFMVPEALPEATIHLIHAWMNLRLDFRVAADDEALIWLTKKLVEKLA